MTIGVWCVASADVVCNPGLGVYPYMLRKGEIEYFSYFPTLDTFSDPSVVVCYNKEFRAINASLVINGCGSDHEHTTECKIGQMLLDLENIQNTLSSPVFDGFYVLRYKKGSYRARPEVFSDELPDEEDAIGLVESMKRAGDGYTYFYKRSSDVELPENSPRYW